MFLGCLPTQPLVVQALMFNLSLQQFSLGRLDHSRPLNSASNSSFKHPRTHQKFIGKLLIINFLFLGLIQ